MRLEPGEFADMVEADEVGLLKAAGFFNPSDTLPAVDKVPTKVPSAPKGSGGLWGGGHVSGQGEKPAQTPAAGGIGTFLSPVIGWLKDTISKGGKNPIWDQPGVPTGGLGDIMGQGSWSLGGTGYGGGAGPGGFYSRRNFDSQGWGNRQQQGGMTGGPTWQPKERQTESWVTGLLDQVQKGLEPPAAEKTPEATSTDVFEERSPEQAPSTPTSPPATGGGPTPATPQVLTFPKPKLDIPVLLRPKDYPGNSDPVALRKWLVQQYPGGPVEAAKSPLGAMALRLFPGLKDYASATTWPEFNYGG